MAQTKTSTHQAIERSFTDDPNNDLEEVCSEAGETVEGAPGVLGCCCFVIDKVEVDNWQVLIYFRNKIYRGASTLSPNSRILFQYYQGGQLILTSQGGGFNLPPDCRTTWYSQSATSLYYQCSGSYTVVVSFQYRLSNGAWATCSSDSADFYLPFNPNYPCF